jgi:hypothetical protein
MEMELVGMEILKVREGGAESNETGKTTQQDAKYE